MRLSAGSAFYYRLFADPYIHINMGANNVKRQLHAHPGSKRKVIAELLVPKRRQYNTNNHDCCCGNLLLDIVSLNNHCGQVPYS